MKTQKNEENNTCVLQTQLYKFSHRIPSYKMSRNLKDCIPIHSFELNPTALPTGKFQLTEDHDQTQNNILEVHSLTSHISYTREFDVRIYIVDYAEYMFRSLHSFEFSIIVANLYPKYKTL